MTSLTHTDITWRNVTTKVSKKAALHGLDSAPALAIVAAHPPNHIGSRVVFCAREAEAVDSGSNHSTVSERSNSSIAIALPVVAVVALL